MRVPATSCRPPADGFPTGLRVLVVDDDVTCLRILEHMLRRCRYQVTTCCQATIALSLLRKRKGGYDVVISDVHMPDMDGFKLLELVGLEMDLPVIMMSADGGTSTVMRGIKHGACDYLIKPVRMEELKNIWQHMIRKKWNGNRELEHSGSLEDSDHHHRMVDDCDIASSVNDGGEGTWRSQKKKRDDNDDEDEGDLDNEDPSASKKPRVVWSVELHQQFVSAVNQLGIDKAVPKRILEMMNVPGLTRENIASHLQKFRLYLKRLSGVAQHHGALPISSNSKVGQFGRLDFQALADSGQIPLQTLAALQAEFLGQPSGDLVFPAVDKPGFLQTSVQGPKSIPIEPEVVYGQPLLKCRSNISKQLPQAIFAVKNNASGFSMCSSNHPGTTSFTRGNTNSTHNGSLMTQTLQQQQPYTLPVESRHAINVQPSCLVVSSPSNSFQMGNSPICLNENTDKVASQASSGIQKGINTVNTKQHSNRNCRNTIMDHDSLSSRFTDIPFGVARVSDGDFNNVSLLDGYSIPGSLSSSVSFCSPGTDSSTGWQIHSSTLNSGPASRLAGDLPDLCILGSESKIGSLPTQGQRRYHRSVGKDTCIPNRFAVDDVESPTDNLNHWKACGDGDRVNQELLLDFTDSSKFRSTVVSQFSANDAIGVLSKDGFAGCFLNS